MSRLLTVRRRALQHSSVREARARRELVQLVRALVNSPHFDQTLYEHQRHRSFRTRWAAAWDFVTEGSRQGLVAGPLLVAPDVSTRDRPAGFGPAAWWAAQVRRTGFPRATAVPLPSGLTLDSPQSDLAALAARTATAVRAGVVQVSPQTTSQPATGGVSATASAVVLPSNDVSHLAALLRVLIDPSSGIDDVVLVASPSTRPDAQVVLSAAAVVSDRIRVIDGSDDAVSALAAGMAAASGRRLVVIGAPLTVDADSLRILIEHLDDDDVAMASPVVLAPDDTVQSAGRDDDGGDRLQGRPWSDAVRAGEVAVASVSPQILIVDRQRVTETAVGTFPSPRFSDLDELVTAWCRALPEGSVRVLAQATASQVLPAGVVAPGTAGADLPTRGDSVVRPLSGDVSHEPLRWAIKSPHPAGPRRHTWGDFHFAQALASALESQGQHVAVDPLDSWYRASGDDDDVVVVLRGLHRYQPAAHHINVLWVISHPNLVDPDELDQVDLAYAASRPWSSARRADGHRVEPLLQCTDAAVFNPEAGDPDTGPTVLFVGNSRGARRPIVDAAFAAGFEPTIIGNGWSGKIPPHCLAADHVPNVELSGLYRSAGVVLNDHWPEMARDGFLSNRLFDLTASAARWVSDPAADLLDVFPHGRIATGPTELGALLSGAPHTFASDDERLAAAQWVREEHSFEARARTLVAAVTRVRSTRA